MQNSEVNIFREVSSKASIVDVIAFYLGRKEIVKKGNRYACRCPFHDDHNPSMNIDPVRNSFKCFVDGTGGDPITFVEKYEHVSPLEALKKVASICNIPLPDSFERMKEKKPLIEEKYPKELEALKATSEMYQLNLFTNEGKAGREYLENRKIPKDVVEHFGIGFAFSDSGELIRRLREVKGFEVSVLETAGILSSGSSLNDRYIDRIMFPIHDNYGHVVAFSGRKIRSDEPGGKYVNYAETPLFHKSDILYHFDKAKDEAKKVGYLFLVEGYMDVIAYARAGYLACCGLMGTALTPSHIETLKNLKVEVRLALDSDEPGRSGIEKALVQLNEAKIPVKVQWAFDKAKDADELLTKFGKEEFDREVNRLLDPVVFLLGRAIGKKGSLRDSSDVLAFLKNVSPFFASLDPLSQDKDIRIISEKTGFDIEAIKNVIVGEESLLKQKEEKIQNRDNDRKWSKELRNPSYRPFYKKETVSYLDMSSMKLGRKYNQGEAEKKVQDAVIDYCQQNHVLFPMNDCLLISPSKPGQDFMKLLCQVEAEIILVVGQKKEAYSLFESSNSAFVITPLYHLNSLFGSYYLKHPGKDSLSHDEYQGILSSFDGEEENKEDNLGDIFDMGEDIDPGTGVEATKSDEELDDLFDLDDIIEEAKDDGYEKTDFDLKDRELLTTILDLLDGIENPLFDPEKFRLYVRQHQKLLDLYHFLKNFIDNKGGKLSTQEYTKYLSLAIQVQNIR